MQAYTMGCSRNDDVDLGGHVQERTCRPVVLLLFFIYLGGAFGLNSMRTSVEPL
jgi:hypothetical protein